jgi:universal stress protein A
MHAIRHILVPSDGSESSTVAAEYACRLALDLGARVTLLRVFEHPAVAMPDALYPASPDEIRILAAHADHALDDLAAALVRPGLALDWEVAEGVPAEQILAVAARDQVDLIIMGTHGRRGLARLLLGSVAEEVVRRATCGVLTLNRPGDGSASRRGGARPRPDRRATRDQSAARRRR